MTGKRLGGECLHCSEPLPLLRTFLPYFEDLCDDCDQAKCADLSRDADAERGVDAPYRGRR